MLIRDARPDDVGVMAEIFYRAVQIGAAPAYSQDQRDAWVSQLPTVENWAKRLDGLETIVAEDGEHTDGFMSMRMDDGYLDLVFVQPEKQGQGIFRRLYTVMENRARARGLTHLTVHASDLLMPVLRNHDWVSLRQNWVERGGVKISNWVMEKDLRATA